MKNLFSPIISSLAISIALAGFTGGAVAADASHQAHHGRPPLRAEHPFLDLSGSHGHVAGHLAANPKYAPGSKDDYEMLIIDGPNAANQRAEIIKALNAGKEVIFDTDGSLAEQQATAAAVKAMLGVSMTSPAFMVSYDKTAQQYFVTPINTLAGTVADSTEEVAESLVNEVGAELVPTQQSKPSAKIKNKVTEVFEQ